MTMPRIPKDEVERRKHTEHWTFDRKVPITLILVLIGQLFGFGWWASDLSTRVGNIEIHQKESFASKEWAIGEHKVLRTNVTNSIKVANNIQVGVDRLEDKMDKVYDLLINHNKNK